MIYSIITIIDGHFDEVKTFQTFPDARSYFITQGDWANRHFGSPDGDNMTALDDVDDLGEGNLVFGYGSCRVTFTAHALN